MGSIKKWIFGLGVFFQGFFCMQLYAQDVPIDQVITTIKNFNFVTTSLGILSDGVSDAVVKQLTALQTAAPRALRIYLTQSNTIWKIFDDFTFLVNEKAVEAILIWPSKAMSDPNDIRKICTMSKKKRIPIIALQKGWIEEGATAFISFENGTKVYVNEQVRSVLNYPIAERAEYEIIKQ